MYRPLVWLESKINYPFTDIAGIWLFVATILIILQGKLDTNIIEYAYIQAIFLTFDEVIHILMVSSMQHYVLKKIKEFSSSTWKFYEKTTMSSRSSITIMEFSRSFDRVIYAKDMHYHSSQLNINIASKSIVVIGMFMYYHQYILLIMAIVLNIFGLLIISKKLRPAYDLYIDTSRKIRRNMFEYSYLCQRRLHEENYPGMADKITNIECDNLQSMHKGNTRLRVIELISILPTLIIFLFIPLFAQKNEYIPIFLTLTRFKDLVWKIIEVQDRKIRQNTDTREFENHRNHLRLVDNVPADEPIPDSLTIYGHIGKINLHIPRLTIQLKDVILIRGASGIGKSTFIDALRGYIDGLCYSSNISPISYSHQISVMIQETYIPTEGTLSLRQLFNDEPNDQLILSMLEVSNMYNWFREFSSQREIDSVSICLQNPLDLPINRKLSGGEKARLKLAMTLVRLKKTQSKWLILDEPENGQDIEDVPNMIKRIFTTFPLITIFIISHICECQYKNLRINKIWTIEVLNGEKTITMTIP